eukprot:5734620-Amphidinium_carterae.1
METIHGQLQSNVALATEAAVRECAAIMKGCNAIRPKSMAQNGDVLPCLSARQFEFRSSLRALRKSRCRLDEPSNWPMLNICCESFSICSRIVPMQAVPAFPPCFSVSQGYGCAWTTKEFWRKVLVDILEELFGSVRSLLARHLIIYSLVRPQWCNTGLSLGSHEGNSIRFRLSPLLPKLDVICVLVAALLPLAQQYLYHQHREVHDTSRELVAEQVRHSASLALRPLQYDYH